MSHLICKLPSLVATYPKACHWLPPPCHICRFLYTGKVTEYCCYGYCIDLLRRLANRTGLQANPTTFTFDLHLVGDGQMGEELTVNDTKVWNGIVGELVTGLADLAVAPMTITPERLTRIDFTKPFKYLGITMLVKRERSKSNLASFLQPFESTLWVLVGVSVNVVAFLLYILDHFSALNYLRKTKSKPNSPPPPTSVSTTSFTDSLHKNSLEASSEVGGKKTAVLANEQTQPAGSTASEDKFTLSSSMWFTWGILLNSGISEETPKAFSTRALGMVWAGFAMIIVASYTANLAAFLVLDRPEASISGIDDVRLRNPQRDFTFATVRGSPVELYFKSQVEYVTIYRTMEGRNVETVEEGIKAVKSGALKAFIWDSARLNYEASHDCELVTAGEVFGRTGYALAMKPGNPWLYELSQAVLSFHERGFMETLDTQWIFSSTEVCANTESSPATLELPNMAGVFIMVAVGIITGLLLLLIEIACDKRRREKKRQTDAVRKAGLHWRQKVQQRKVRLADQKFNSHATSTLPTFVDECQKHKFSWPSSPIRPLSKMAKPSSSPIEAILVPKTSLPSYACAPSSLPTSTSQPQPLFPSPPPSHLQPTNGTQSAAYQTGLKHCTQGPEAPNNQLYRSRMHPGVARPRRKFTRNVITAPVNFTASPKKNVRI
nr:unnamed protein product [Spirometra erinaceieuropaei]